MLADCLHECYCVGMSKGDIVNVKQYRIEPGHYVVNGYTILWGGSRHWQLRDSCDDLIDDYTTLRDAMRDAFAYSRLVNGAHS